MTKYEAYKVIAETTDYTTAVCGRTGAVITTNLAAFGKMIEESGCGRGEYVLIDAGLHGIAGGKVMPRPFVKFTK